MPTFTQYTNVTSTTDTIQAGWPAQFTASLGKARKKYPSKTKRGTFTRIVNTEFDKEGTVESFLSAQFTVNYDDGSFGYLFNKDKGVTWNPLDQREAKTHDEHMENLLTSLDEAETEGAVEIAIAALEAAE